MEHAGGMSTETADETRARTALGHITICDLSGQLAGAGSTRYLAAFGARVIRVEDPVRQGRWDIIRGTIPHVDERRGIELGGGFNNHNVEKLGVTINLRLESGRDLFRRLVEVSDVVTENFAAGVMAKLGFPYEELRRIKPDLIYVSNSGFGSDGPYAGFKTFGPVVQAVCGLTFGVGRADGPPAGWGFSYMDHMGADLMALAVLAGLAHRHRTGEGQWIDMSCTEAGLGLTGPDLLDYTVNRATVTSTGDAGLQSQRRPGNGPARTSTRRASPTVGWPSRVATTRTGRHSSACVARRGPETPASGLWRAGWKRKRSSTAWSLRGPRPAIGTRWPPT